MNFWQFQRMISRRLLSWSLFSMVLGLALRGRGAFNRGLSSQFLGWGFIDALIALGGQYAAEQRLADYENPGAEEVKAKESRNLSRALWLNAGLDVLYMIAGLLVARRGHSEDKQERRGVGWGIFVQGLFLFVFDLYHALKMPPPDR